MNADEFIPHAFMKLFVQVIYRYRPVLKLEGRIFTRQFIHILSSDGMSSENLKILICYVYSGITYSATINGYLFRKNFNQFPERSKSGDSEILLRFFFEQSNLCLQPSIFMHIFNGGFRILQLRRFIFVDFRITLCLGKKSRALLIKGYICSIPYGDEIS
jgi:hypothetical protein